MINFGIISNVLGVLLILIGAMMLSTLTFSFYFSGIDASAIMKSGSLTILLGLISLYYKFDNKERVGKREGYLIVATGWISMCIVGSLPYIFSGTLPNLTDAFFESVSGLTTTGASVINDIEAMPKGILFWRSLTQWIGGMGIIVLTVAIFPLLGIGGVELFVAEAPGPTSDKIHPRIKETAKRLWGIYVGLTIILAIILYLNNLSIFDSVNHAMTTMATGGFSTKNASMAHFSPAIQYWTTLFMFLAGINYTLIYFGLHGKFNRVWKSEEFKAYSFVITILIIIVSSMVYFRGGISPELAFREASFQIISVITTTGFVTADYTAWTPGLTFLFFVLLFTGGCAGSTAGGIKFIRHLVLFKNSFLEFKRLLHPKAMIRTKIDNQIVAPRILTHVLVFLLVYLLLFVFGSIVMAIILRDFNQPILTAIGAVATSLGNVGPAIGELGPLDNFANVPPSGKWVLAFLMLLGRLELFTILILFMPYFWKVN